MSWSFVQRSPTYFGASLCVIQKPQEWGGPGPLGAVAPQGKKVFRLLENRTRKWRIFLSCKWNHIYMRNTKTVRQHKEAIMHGHDLHSTTRRNTTIVVLWRSCPCIIVSFGFNLHSGDDTLQSCTTLWKQRAPCVLRNAVAIRRLVYQYHYVQQVVPVKMIRVIN